MNSNDPSNAFNNRFMEMLVSEHLDAFLTKAMARLTDEQVFALAERVVYAAAKDPSRITDAIRGRSDFDGRRTKSVLEEVTTTVLTKLLDAPGVRERLVEQVEKQVRDQLERARIEIGLRVSSPY